MTLDERFDLRGKYFLALDGMNDYVGDEFTIDVSEVEKEFVATLRDHIERQIKKLPKDAVPVKEKVFYYTSGTLDRFPLYYKDFPVYIETIYKEDYNHLQVKFKIEYDRRTH